MSDVSLRISGGVFSSDIQSDTEPSDIGVLFRYDRVSDESLVFGECAAAVASGRHTRCESHKE